MTHEANDRRPRRDNDSDAEADLPDSAQRDEEQPNPRPRVGWSDSTPESSGAPGDAAATSITGTPTPGHQVPTGQPEDSPDIVARPLTGTTPKATNDRPQAPAGAGSQPTVPRPVAQGRRDVAPDFQRPATPLSNAASEGSSTEPPASSDGAAPDAPLERPENPFAPKDDDAPRKSRVPFPGWKNTASAKAEEDTTGKRIAQRESRRLRLGRRRGRQDGADNERVPLGSRNVIALTIAGVAVVAIVALVASTALWWFNRGSEVAGDASGPDLGATPGPVLSPDQMLSASMAKEIDPTRTWTQTLDQAGVSDSSPTISCIGPLAAGQPIPQITHLRSLSASGNDRTQALHRADAYESEEEAERVFDFRGSELGACTGTSYYVEKGLDVTGIGDEALGVRLVLVDEKSQYHSVLLVRTGRVVNLLDVARAENPVDMEAQVKALGQAINRQCGPAVGLCSAPTTSVEIGVPPAGGEQPGFLTSGDIPRVTPGSGTWRGNPPATQIDIQDGTGCEAVDFGSVGGSGVTREQRTYLLRNDAAAPPQFGIDQVVLTMESPEAAQQLVQRVSDNIKGCQTRTLTSKMVEEAPLSTPGQDGVEIRGNWFVVESKIDQAEAQRYRVGAFSADNRFVYLRSNPTERFDFTDEAWIGVNLRAGERVTQAL